MQPTFYTSHNKSIVLAHRNKEEEKSDAPEKKELPSLSNKEKLFFESLYKKGLCDEKGILQEPLSSTLLPQLNESEVSRISQHLQTPIHVHLKNTGIEFSFIPLQLFKHLSAHLTGMDLTGSMVPYLLGPSYGERALNHPIGDLYRKFRMQPSNSNFLLYLHSEATRGDILDFKDQVVFFLISKLPMLTEAQKDAALTAVKNTPKREELYRTLTKENQQFLFCVIQELALDALVSSHADNLDPFVFLSIGDKRKGFLTITIMREFSSNRQSYQMNVHDTLSIPIQPLLQKTEEKKRAELSDLPTLIPTSSVGKGMQVLVDYLTGIIHPLPANIKLSTELQWEMHISYLIRTGAKSERNEREIQLVRELRQIAHKSQEGAIHYFENLLNRCLKNRFRNHPIAAIALTASLIPHFGPKEYREIFIAMRKHWLHAPKSIYFLGDLLRFHREFVHHPLLQMGCFLKRQSSQNSESEIQVQMNEESFATIQLNIQGHHFFLYSRTQKALQDLAGCLSRENQQGLEALAEFFLSPSPYQPFPHSNLYLEPLITHCDSFLENCSTRLMRKIGFHLALAIKASSEKPLFFKHLFTFFPEIYEDPNNVNQKCALEHLAAALPKNLWVPNQQEMRDQLFRSFLKAFSNHKDWPIEKWVNIFSLNKNLCEFIYQFWISYPHQDEIIEHTFGIQLFQSLLPQSSEKIPHLFSMIKRKGLIFRLVQSYEKEDQANAYQKLIEELKRAGFHKIVHEISQVFFESLDEEKGQYVPEKKQEILLKLSQQNIDTKNYSLAILALARIKTVSLSTPAATLEKLHHTYCHLLSKLIREREFAQTLYLLKHLFIHETEKKEFYTTLALQKYLELSHPSFDKIEREVFKILISANPNFNEEQRKILFLIGKKLVEKNLTEPGYQFLGTCAKYPEFSPLAELWIRKTMHIPKKIHYIFDILEVYKIRNEEIWSEVFFQLQLSEQSEKQNCWEFLLTLERLEIFPPNSPDLYPFWKGAIAYLIQHPSPEIFKILEKEYLHIFLRIAVESKRDAKILHNMFLTFFKIIKNERRKSRKAAYIQSILQLKNGFVSMIAKFSDLRRRLHLDIISILLTNKNFSSYIECCQLLNILFEEMNHNQCYYKPEILAVSLEVTRAIATLFKKELSFINIVPDDRGVIMHTLIKNFIDTPKPLLYSVHLLSILLNSKILEFQRMGAKLFNDELSKEMAGNLYVSDIWKKELFPLQKPLQEIINGLIKNTAFELDEPFFSCLENWQLVQSTMITKQQRSTWIAKRLRNILPKGNLENQFSLTVIFCDFRLVYYLKYYMEIIGANDHQLTISIKKNLFRNMIFFSLRCKSYHVFSHFIGYYKKNPIYINHHQTDGNSLCSLDSQLLATELQNQLNALNQQELNENVVTEFLAYQIDLLDDLLDESHYLQSSKDTFIHFFETVSINNKPDLMERARDLFDTAKEKDLFKDDFASIVRFSFLLGYDLPVAKKYWPELSRAERFQVMHQILDHYLYSSNSVENALSFLSDVHKEVYVESGPEALFSFYEKLLDFASQLPLSQVNRDPTVAGIGYRRSVYFLFNENLLPFSTKLPNPQRDQSVRKKQKDAKLVLGWHMRIIKAYLMYLEKCGTCRVDELFDQKLLQTQIINTLAKFQEIFSVHKEHIPKDFRLEIVSQWTSWIRRTLSFINNIDNGMALIEQLLQGACKNGLYRNLEEVYQEIRKLQSEEKGQK